jgi:hypothetical protein
MSTTHSRPSWLSEPCPAWCTRSHHDDDHPDDRWHDSETTLVPVTALRRDTGAGAGRFEPEQAVVTIVTSRHVGDTVTTTFIGYGDRPHTALQLTPESAARLAEAVTRHASMVADDRRPAT